MAKISTYPVDGLISTDDLLIGTDAENVNVTKNFTIGGVMSIANLQWVLDNGNTATENIVLTGNVSATNLAASAAVTAPSATITTVGATTINATAVNATNANVTGSLTANDVEVSGLFYDSTASEGTNGQILKSTGTGVEWFTFAETQNLQAVLTSGNTTSLNIVSTGDITADAINANAIEADDFTVNSQLSITGTIEADGSIGTAGQVLASQGGAGSVEWVSLPAPVIPGWNRYDDQQYTPASKLVVNDGVTVTLPNDGNKFSDMYGTESFYSPDTSTILAINENDTYIITVTFKASASNTSNGHLDISMSGPVGYNRIAQTITFPKGNNIEHNIHLVYQYYADADFVTNGAQFEVRPDGTDVSIWDIIYFIQRVQVA
jgi:hypothetical protein